MKNANHLTVALTASMFTLTASMAIAASTSSGADLRETRHPVAIEIFIEAGGPHVEVPPTGEAGETAAPAHEEIGRIEPVRDAKEFVPAPKAGDLNASGRVDVDDFLLLMQDWGTCNGGEKLLGDIAPTSGDCIVGVDDLLMLVENWDG